MIRAYKQENVALGAMFFIIALSISNNWGQSKNKKGKN